MVEMVETAAILNCARPRSLVILDEIGRGTATFDGLSIAWATIEHLHEVNRSRALFATHFHELTQLTKRIVPARQSDDEGDGSRGRGRVSARGGRKARRIAHMACMSRNWLAFPRASSLARTKFWRELEAGDRRAPVEKMIDDLPLFSHAPAPLKTRDPLREALKAIDPDALTPREALAALYELKGKLEK